MIVDKIVIDATWFLLFTGNGNAAKSGKWRYKKSESGMNLSLFSQNANAGKMAK